MAETLLAILLVTTSAKGSSIVYRWPPSPVASPRFTRPGSLHLDNPWRASHPSEVPPNPFGESIHLQNDPEREWKRPSTQRDRSMSFSSSGSHPSSGRNSPTKDMLEPRPIEDEYNHLFGYSSDFLGQSSKFELLVDDLAFIGHPVSAEDNGAWRFKPEKLKLNDRGRESRIRRVSQTDRASSASPPRPASSEKTPLVASLWLQRFHFVIVLDVPDPFYFDIIYEQIAFPVAAVLFQEQVLSNFVEEECDILEEENEPECLTAPDDDDYQVWGQEMSFGYRLPSLTAWKSLLLLDDGPEGIDPYANLRRSLIGTGDRSLVEGLIKFLEIASVTLSLADMASLLDWDLETQVFPTVRWLVHHRRAKVVDIVHPGLKTVFTLPPKFDAPMSQLTADFNTQFGHSGSDTHFFASVVQSKEAIPLYHEVVLWMLKRDMLITLHLHIRIVATVRLKERVKFAAKGRSRDRKSSGRKGHSKLRNQLDADAERSPPGVAWLALSPGGARRYTRDSSAGGSRNSRLSELILPDDSDSDGRRREESETPESQDELDSHAEDDEEATTLQRRWLSAMSDGKDNPVLVRRFEQINQYFDGRRTDDEILYRAEMSRRELREILHHYDEYISCKHFCIRREGACKHLRKRGGNEAVLARSGILYPGNVPTQFIYYGKNMTRSKQ
ncbi:hypothetical protein B0H14DRAFT_2666007 [Mycena olivaceomarginata]|nr:hypothetical protein B0H14DRAFT_2666007 [Mycena olivaceomarginata]